MLKTYHIMTFGCQMNENDSEKLSAMLKNLGYEKTGDAKSCDVLVINTCSVRENADDRFFGNLGNFKKIKRERPDMTICVCGCMMQQKEIVDTVKKKYPFVDIIFGTHNIHQFPELLLKHFETRNNVCQLMEDGPIMEGLRSDREFTHKAFVSIMNGCDNFCTYCIVPYTRGREKSREPEYILDEIRDLAENGLREVMLLGQNVNSYGKGLKNPCSFAELLQKTAQIEGIKRVRFMTSHPKDLNDDVIRVMKENEKICHNIHLPFQSGSTRILKLMNRHYTKESYIALIRKIRREIPDITLSTDIIVGFPTETEEDFQDTLDVLRQCRFDSAFTFIYSPRNGTRAAKMEGQVDKATVKDRFDRLLSLQYEIMRENVECLSDTCDEVLVEGVSKTNGSMMSGRTRTNRLVNFSGECGVGDLVEVHITEVGTFHLTGELTKIISKYR